MIFMIPDNPIPIPDDFPDFWDPDDDDEDE